MVKTFYGLVFFFKISIGYLFLKLCYNLVIFVGIVLTTLTDVSRVREVL